MRSARAGKTSATVTNVPSPSRIGSTSKRPTCKGSVIERLPPREALVDPVPEGDLRLAHMPAQENVLAVAQRGEVEQPFLEALHLDTGVVEDAHAFRDSIRL